MYQVGNSLTASRTQLAGYQELKSATTVTFYRTIAQYLQSGDASLLTLAQQQLGSIFEHAKHIKINALFTEIKENTTKLNHDIETKYRALGKLSGDPLALIRNAEQSMLSLTHAIAQYSKQSQELSPQQHID